MFGKMTTQDLDLGRISSCDLLLPALFSFTNVLCRKNQQIGRLSILFLKQFVFLLINSCYFEPINPATILIIMATMVVLKKNDNTPWIKLKRLIWREVTLTSDT
jgi:hypothetical protein